MKNKRFLSGVLCLAVLLGAGASSFAEETPAETERVVHLTDPGDVLKLAKDCILDAYSENLTVCLDNDIDLGGVPMSPVPIFSGTFNGGGHRISGFVLATDGSHQGFFRYVAPGAQILNLKLEGSVEPDGSRTQIGGIAGVNNGEISRCSFKGSVSGLNYIGGIAGVNNGVIASCTAEGTVLGKRFTGGIAGYNAAGASVLNCRNRAAVNTEITEGGIDIDKLNISNALDTLNFVSVQDEDIVSDSGGIVGFSQGEIASCSNAGQVGYRHYGYNVGGIAGRQSGYLHDCSNEGEVLGRRDVGGIVGQMEPYLIIKDRQSIADAINNLTASVAAGLRNLGRNSEDIRDVMANFSDSAEYISHTVVGYYDEEGFHHGTGIPIEDPNIKAKVHDAMDAMYFAMEDMGAYTYEAVDGAVSDFQVTNSNAYVVMNLLSGALSGNLVTELYEDVSDSASEDDIQGKVSLCKNSAPVEGDANVGGIAGNMAVEIEFDMEGALLELFEERTEVGIESVLYQSKCLNSKNTNSGPVETKKDYAGGIVGYQDVGTVVACESYGDVVSGEGFAGGIAGRSNAIIRGSYAMCNLDAAEYVGGIAGYGVNITDCGTLVRMDNATAAFGAIAGYAYNFDAENKKIFNDFFVSEDLGAVDGISYAGLAEAIDYASFANNEAVPEVMKDLKLVFKADGKVVKELPFTYGGSIPRSDIPEVPEKPGYSGAWEDFRYTDLYFSDVIEAVYEPHLGAVATEATREEGGLPLIVLDGEFAPETKLTVTPYAGELDTEKLLEAWTLTIDGSLPDVYYLRFLKPDVRHAEVFVLQDGQWQKQSAGELGSYLAFDASGRELTFAVYEKGLLS